MGDPMDTLQIRQHSRRQCRVEARARVEEAARDRVTPSRSMTDAERWFPVQVVDVSEGGLGLESPLFLPRGCLLSVRTAAKPGDADCQMPFQCRVQRVSMHSAKPVYYLGLSFVGGNESNNREVARMIGLDGSAAA